MHNYHGILYRYKSWFIINIHINENFDIYLNTHNCKYNVNLKNKRRILQHYYLFNDNISFNIKINNSSYQFNESPKYNKFRIQTNYKIIEKNKKKTSLCTNQITKIYDNNINSQEYCGANHNFII